MRRIKIKRVAGAICHMDGHTWSGPDYPMLLVPQRDYRLLLAVARAANTLKLHRVHSVPDILLAADFMIAALDALNAKPRKRT